MYGKRHTEEATIGKNNPRYGIKMSEKTKELISKAKSKNPIDIYDLEGKIIKTFINAVKAGE